jgi:hypothetical protein
MHYKDQNVIINYLRIILFLLLNFQETHYF